MRGGKGRARSQSNKRPEQRQRHARAWQVHAVRVAGREEIRRVDSVQPIVRGTTYS